MLRRTLAVSGLLLLALGPQAARAAAPACPRGVAGGTVPAPADLYSSNGLLDVALSYRSGTDPQGRTVSCFVTSDGQESPTLHVNPGDTLRIELTNDLPAGDAKPMAMHGMAMDAAKGADGTACGDTVVLPTSVNLHFHGMNVAPTCHQDEVIHTLVNPGTTFTYSMVIPKDEPPGLYWYHPHIHGLSHTQVNQGATGAIVVEGIEKVVPATAGLPQRVLVSRTSALTVPPDDDSPELDLSLNYVPIDYPANTPATLVVPPGRTELWRMVNANSDTILDLTLSYDGVVQPLQLVAMDGVPLGSQDGRAQGHPISRSHIVLPPASRAEFIVTTPAASVKQALLQTAAINTGPTGDSDTARTLAVISPTGTGLAGATPPHGAAETVSTQRFAGLNEAAVTAKRSLYFSEIIQGLGGDDGSFYITVDGQLPKLFDPSAPPAITTTQGAVEDWTIENQTHEVHVFHIHQIHFELLARNGVAVPKNQQQMLDTITVPYWNGHGAYPSVTLRMDFRGPVVGDFVYHCHILDHEDNGMMAIIRVQPKAQQAAR
jgi:FtsP/CotA-like multicopper oxidase with cupredoxin domain